MPSRVSDMTPLERVERAAAARRRAEQQYRAAVLAAATAGESYGAIGRAAGITRQAARYLARTGDSR